MNNPSGGEEDTEGEEPNAFTQHLNEFWNDLKFEAKRARFIIEILALVGLGLYTCETHRTNNLTKAALQNTKEQFTQSQATTKEQFAMDQRPYVWLEVNKSFEGKNSRLSYDPPSKNLSWNVYYTNFGKSPAIITGIDRHLEIGPTADSKVEFRPIKVKSISILPPGASNFTTVSNSPLEEAAVDAARGTDNIYMFGHIEYTDSSGRPYSSEFCQHRLATSAVASCPNHPDQIK